MEKVQELGITGVEFDRIGVEDVYVHHGAQDILRAEHDLQPAGIASRMKKLIERGREPENVSRIASR
jgi:transketolase C-terminal domain/subunit